MFVTGRGGAGFLIVTPLSLRPGVNILSFLPPRVEQGPEWATRRGGYFHFPAVCLHGPPSYHPPSFHLDGPCFSPRVIFCDYPNICLQGLSILYMPYYEPPMILYSNWAKNTVHRTSLTMLALILFGGKASRIWLTGPPNSTITPIWLSRYASHVMILTIWR